MSAQTVEQQYAFFQQTKRRFGMYSASETGEVAARAPAAIMEGLIPAGSVNLLVGDSGIGKTPLIYQLGLSVAAGLPFLGFAAKASRVLMVDYENPIEDAHRILEQQRSNLGLERFPPYFLLWPFHLAPADSAEQALEEAMRTLTPELVILDSLRTYCSRMEGASSSAAAQVKQLRRAGARGGAAVLLVHHIHKRYLQRHTPLETTPALDWLMHAAGSRALINQTDVRLAIARPRTLADRDSVLVLRGHYRTRGEVGPFLLRRRKDAAGQPFGYSSEPLPPPLFENPDHEAFYHRLPAAFDFREACAISRLPRSSTSRVLTMMLGQGLLRKTAPGLYEKAGCSGNGGIAT
jgi:archaellum biogenesis ATPase FlaH